ncbi:hypothetical protein [Ureibacillus sp. FSL K6-0165]|uniref:hypothetical protein n=1 Tax=Ureibacillus sp. FSL K6-0165 TaxID=2954606 RepID=UPI0030FCEFBE
MNVIYISEKPSTSPEIDEQIQLLYQLGLYKEANKMFNSFARDIISDTRQPDSEEHKKSIIEYNNSIKKLHSASTIILTHERLLQLGTLKNIETVIIDEDITPSILKTGSIEIEDLNGLLTSKNELIRKFIDYVKSTSSETYFETLNLTLIIC